MNYTKEQVDIIKSALNGDDMLVNAYAGCVDSSTQYLTEDGWKYINEYNGEDIAIVSEKFEQSVVFSKPLDYIHNKGTFKAYEINGMTLTPDHRVAFTFYNKYGTDSVPLRAEPLIDILTKKPNGLLIPTYRTIKDVKHNNYKLKELTYDDVREVRIDGSYCFTTETSYWLAKKGNNVFVTGNSGKTATLFEIMRHSQQKLPSKKFLLLSFNKHLHTEYQEKIAKLRLNNVDALTIHSLAKRMTIDTGIIRVMGKDYPFTQFKLLPFIHGNELRSVVGKGNPWKLSNELRTFCTNSQTFEDANSNMYKIFDHFLSKRIITFDMYMKIFMLGVVDGSIKVDYDCLLLDEVNDISEVLYNVFKNLPIKQKIAVGDRYQQLYEFLLKGFSAFEQPYLKTFKQKTLSRTFRCSKEIASMVDTNVLKPYCDAELTFEGTDNPIDPDAQTHCYITRTNNNVLELAYNLVRSSKKYKFTDTWTNLTKDIKDIAFVMSNQQAYRNVRSLKALKNVSKVLQDEKEREGIEFYSREIDTMLLQDILMFNSDTANGLSFTQYLQKYSSNTKTKTGISLLARLSQKKLSLSKFLKVIKGNLDKNSNITVSNCFKVKGSEFSSITLYKFDDFNTLIVDYGVKLQKELRIKPINNDYEFNKKLLYTNRKETVSRQYFQEVYLLYVALTRAKHSIDFIDCSQHTYWH